MHQLEELSIELTNECIHTACRHCSSGSVSRPLKDELTAEKVTDLVAEARGLGATVLSLSGGNPILSDHILLAVDMAMLAGYERILVYTTGHNRDGRKLSDWRVISHFLGKGVTWIFSLHSHLPEVNDWIMNLVGATKDIKNSIEWLIDHNEKVEIHMVPMKPNYKDIIQMSWLCDRLGVSKLSLLRFVPQTRGNLNRADLGMTKGDFFAMQLDLYNLINSVDDVEIRLGCPIDFLHIVGGTKSGKAKPCHAGDDLMLVRPNGDVHPCAAWKSLPADCNVWYYEHPLTWIWEHSEVFNAIREFKESGFREVESCAHCKHLESCKTGCLAQRLHKYGSGLEDLYDNHSDPLCALGTVHD